MSLRLTQQFCLILLSLFKPSMNILFPVAALLFFQSVSCSVATLSPLLLASGAANSDKTGYYIVVLKEDITHERFKDIISQVVPLSEDAELHGSVERIVKAFTVKLSEHALNSVSIQNFEV